MSPSPRPPCRPVETLAQVEEKVRTALVAWAWIPDSGTPPRLRDRAHPSAHYAVDAFILRSAALCECRAHRSRPLGSRNCRCISLSSAGDEQKLRAVAPGEGIYTIERSFDAGPRATFVTTMDGSSATGLAPATRSSLPAVLHSAQPALHTSGVLQLLCVMVLGASPRGWRNGRLKACSGGQ